MKSKFLNKIIKSIPNWAWRFIDPTTIKIKNVAFSFAQKLPKGAKVLDAGAGEAPYKSFFKHCDYFACDFGLGDQEWDYSMIDFFGNLKCLPFENGEFDAIICTQVLEHVNNPFQVTGEFSRILKNGGKLLLSAPQGWGEHQTPHDYFRYTSYGLIHILKEAGFSVNVVSTSCGYFGYLANRLTVFPKALFWERKGWGRILLFPLELLSYLVFVAILPVILNLLDPLDKKKQYTLNYIVESIK